MTTDEIATYNRCEPQTQDFEVTAAPILGKRPLAVTRSHLRSFEVAKI